MPRFVPCRIAHLLGELSQLLPQRQRGAFYELARVIEALQHHAASSQTRTAEDLYAPFDPDAETVPVAAPRLPDPVGRLYDWLGGLFERANFNRVEREDLLTKTDEEVLTNFEIDPDLRSLERLAVYTRGRGTKAERVRRAERWFRLEESEVPTHRRVAIVVRTAHDPGVLIKLFKDVPSQDLELLLPTVRVKMKLLDKLKLSGSGGAAAVSVWKVLRLAYTYAPTLTKLLAVPFKLFLLPIALIVSAIYGGKTALDYSKIRSSYVTALAEHLYAITLASNRAALGRLARMAGEEDTKEALIAYAILLSEPGGRTPAELQTAANEFVWDRYRAKVDFDVEDALRKLRDLSVIEDESTEHSESVVRAVPIDEALRRADRAWDDLYSPPPRETRLWRLLKREEDEARADAEAELSSERSPVEGANEQGTPEGNSEAGDPPAGEDERLEAAALAEEDAHTEDAHTEDAHTEDAHTEDAHTEDAHTEDAHKEDAHKEDAPGPDDSAPSSLDR